MPALTPKLDQFHVRLCFWLEALVQSGAYRSEAAIARALELRPQNLAAFKNGSRKPGAEVLARFALLGLSLNWLMNGGDASAMFYTPPGDATEQARALAATLSDEDLLAILAVRAKKRE